MLNANLLFNPNSGRCRTEGITRGKLIEILRQHDIDVSIFDVHNENDIAYAVAELPEDSNLIIAGGDGTIHQALQYPVCLNVNISIIPLGTANNLAISAGIPMDIDKAVNIIKNGVVKHIDLGTAGEIIFIEAAGIGFHANAFHIYGIRHDKSLIDASRAFLSSLINWNQHKYSVTVDGENLETEAIQITVANTPVYGRHIPIAPNASIDDGILDIVIIRCADKIEFIKCIMNIMEGKGLDSSKIMYIKGKVVEIIPLTNVPVPVYADSDPAGYAPVIIEVLPGCLKLVAPE